MQKLLIGIAADEIHNQIEENDILPEQQKDCHRNSRCKKDQLLNDRKL